MTTPSTSPIPRIQRLWPAPGRDSRLVLDMDSFAHVVTSKPPSRRHGLVERFIRAAFRQVFKQR